MRGADGPFQYVAQPNDDDYRLGFKGPDEVEGEIANKTQPYAAVPSYPRSPLDVKQNKITTCSIELKQQTQTTYFI
jgi:hypothetical protein